MVLAVGYIGVYIATGKPFLLQFLKKAQGLRVPSCLMEINSLVVILVYLRFFCSFGDWSSLFGLIDFSLLGLFGGFSYCRRNGNISLRGDFMSFNFCSCPNIITRLFLGLGFCFLFGGGLVLLHFILRLCGRFWFHN